MAFLKVLNFNREPQKPPPNLMAARIASSIAYDPELVPALKKDHQDLVQLYAQIGIKLANHAYGDVQKSLVEFKTHLQGHLLVENVRFYNYLEQHLEGDSTNYELMRDFRREMNRIARSVVEYVKTYQNAKFSTSVVQQFSRDYNAVGELLKQRIGREESGLYVLYQP